jgi:hypothetical protein
MHEYKVVPAPARPAKAKGLKTTADRFAHTLALALNDHAAEGWEFVRTETFAVEERKGLFGGTRTVMQPVMILRRSLALRATPVAAEPPLRLQPEYAPAHAPDNPPPAYAEPDGRAEPIFRPGAMMRADGARKYPPLRRADEDGAPEDGR